MPSATELFIPACPGARSGRSHLLTVAKAIAREAGARGMNAVVDEIRGFRANQNQPSVPRCSVRGNVPQAFGVELAQPRACSLPPQACDGVRNRHVMLPRLRSGR